MINQFAPYTAARAPAHTIENAHITMCRRSPAHAVIVVLCSLHTALPFAVVHFTRAHRCQAMPLPLPPPPKLPSPSPSHDHRNGLPLRQPQTATRHVPPLTPCLWSRGMRRLDAEPARSRGRYFMGVIQTAFGCFMGVTEIILRSKPIPRRPGVASLLISSVSWG